ncbi:hypothetical protein EIP91_008039 [Steccherinum ochraceum]|uniref:F-box domain-containing protein n=1 Tax=Steccherinum ochraceum TaxID=92696 RepID=A0A4R0RDI8_9APHY|nr:hypothetical protein EIP91_008039 [Steccherinum ochraceum]
MTLPSIPVELLLSIFSFACTDDGQTGRALNATSKAFRDICLGSSVDLQCVAIHGCYGIKLFSDIVSQRKYPRVESLLLSDDSDYGDDSELAYFTLDILHALSRPHLRILHINTNIRDHFRSRSPPEDDQRHPVAWLPISFPSLVDLQLPCHLHHFNFSYTSTTTSPALRSLRIALVLPGLSTLLAREFPNLVDLTIDAPITGPIAAETFLYLGEYCRSGPPSPPSLRNLVVYLAPSEEEGCPIYPWMYTNGEWRHELGEELAWDFELNVPNEAVQVWHHEGGLEGPLEVEVGLESSERMRTVFPPPAELVTWIGKQE